MPEPSADQDEGIDIRQLANAIRLVFFVVVLGMASVTLFICQSIDRFETIYRDMLGGRPLPLLTTLVLSGRPFLLALSLTIPAAAIGTLFTRRVVLSIYVLAALGFLAVAVAGLVFPSLFLPLLEIIKQMGQGAGA